MLKVFAAGTIRRMVKLLICLLSFAFSPLATALAQTSSTVRIPAMYFSDTSRIGVPFAKDPSVVEFHGAYYMYFSLPPRPTDKMSEDHEQMGWGIGIASSRDLLHWKKVGEIPPTQPIEQRGILAPGARVIDGKVHLFYQTYGWFMKDAICHATSTDGLHFTKDKTNPIYRPEQLPWSVGRAIDAEAVLVPSGVYLYFATRDPQMKQQLIGLSSSSNPSRLSRGDWKDISLDGPLLKPELPWEKDCIEAPTVLRRNGIYYMFYAGAWNNQPQQIGVARSDDGIHWKRLGDHPFLANGAPGSWNSSESGHPGLLTTHGRTFLFFQGNNDNGHTYFLSKVEVGWKGEEPYAMVDSSGATAPMDSRP